MKLDAPGIIGCVLTCIGVILFLASAFIEWFFAVGILLGLIFYVLGMGLLLSYLHVREGEKQRQ